LEDVLATGTGGAYTIATTLVAIAVSAVRRGFFADSFPLLATITIVATLLRQLIFWTVMAFEGYPSGLSGVHFHQALVQSVLNGLTMMFVMAVARRFDSRYE
jgi:cell shape-determining protein MreD